jgi:DNA-binding NtrC family response regulator
MLGKRLSDSPAFQATHLNAVIALNSADIGERKFRLAVVDNEDGVALLSRDWPGNVRELMNTVEMLTLVSDGEVIEPSALPYEWHAGVDEASLRLAREAGFRSAVDEFERRLLVEAIERAGGVKARAARDLKLNPSQMKYLSQKHKL